MAYLRQKTARNSEAKQLFFKPKSIKKVDLRKNEVKMIIFFRYNKFSSLSTCV